MPVGRPAAKYSQALRLLRIMEVLQQRREVTLAELVRSFGVSRRTLQRDLGALEELYLIERSGGAGEHDRIVEVRTGRRTDTLRLSVSEMIALTMSRNLFRFAQGTELMSAIESLFEKLAARLADHDGGLRENLQKKLYATAGFPRAYHQAEDVVDDLLSGLVRQRKLRVTYQPPGRTPYQDVVHPYTLVVHNHALFVVCHSERAAALRVFAVDRIQASEWLKKEPFAYPEGYDPHTLFSSAFGITLSDTQVDLRLRFSPSIAPYVASRRWHTTMTSAPTQDGGVEVAMRVPVTEELLHWLTGYGGAVEILEPPAVRAEVQARHRAALAQEPPGHVLSQGGGK